MLGNQTPNVSCAILERLFDDPNMKLWDYDSETLLPNLPTMVTFPHFEVFYADWAADLKSKGVTFKTSTQVTAILKRDKDGVVLETAPIDPYKENSEGQEGVFTGEPSVQEFDFLVMAVLADDAKRLLGKTATWREKFVLGGARFYDDITITHSDSKYFEKNYEVRFKPELCAKAKSESQEEMIKFAKDETQGQDGEPGGFRPMYYTHSYAEDPSKIEMSFDCTNYQHQFRTENDDAAVAPVPYENHVFQSIFLDKNNRHLWTIDDIDESKVICKKWWHQLGHRWQHYVRVVPGMMFINGKNNTYFAGSWTLVVSCSIFLNSIFLFFLFTTPHHATLIITHRMLTLLILQNMHELACVSGIAAAYRLGAEYVKFDDFAEDFFKKYLLISHGVLYKGGKKQK